MASNCVVPRRAKVEKSDGVLVETDEYEVDVEGLPMLVARGVMPFRFLRMRGDFKERFSGCKNSFDVIGVLGAEWVFDG